MKNLKREVARADNTLDSVTVNILCVCSVCSFLPPPPSSIHPAYLQSIGILCQRLRELSRDHQLSNPNTVGPHLDKLRKYESPDPEMSLLRFTLGKLARVRQDGWVVIAALSTVLKPGSNSHVSQQWGGKYGLLHVLQSVVAAPLMGAQISPF